MKKAMSMGAAVALALVMSSCGGGGGGGGGSPAPAPPPVTDDDARRAVLADLGEKLILPTLRDVDGGASAMKTAIDALAAAPTDAAARSAAQAAWRTAMAAVQRAEVLQIGPAAATTEPGGAGLQMQIHAFPQFDACAIHAAAYADEPVTAATPAGRVGMGAIEYLLFSDADNAACPPGSAVNGGTKRAQHAARLATRVSAVATQLRTAWEPGGGNFLRQFSTAGAGGMVYGTPQIAMNAVSTAIFYFEKQSKDRKMAQPTGIGATGLSDCLTVSCPEFLESPYSHNSGNNIRMNLQAFREVFTGSGGGLGLNALMQGMGRTDLVNRFSTMLTNATAGAEAVPDMDAAVAAITSRSACLLASNSRSGTPAVCTMHGLIDEVTDLLRTEIVSTLNLRIPDSAAGDND